MDKRDEITDFIKNDLLKGTDVSQLGYDDDLLMSGLVNSIDIMRLVAFVESAYDVTIPAEDIVIEHFETVNAIHNYITTIVTQ